MGGSTIRDGGGWLGSIPPTIPPAWQTIPPFFQRAPGAGELTGDGLPTTTPGTFTGSGNVGDLGPITFELRHWLARGVLGRPDGADGFREAIFWLLVGFGLLAVLALAAQRTAFPGQLFDLPSRIALWRKSLDRFSLLGRLIALALLLTMLEWTIAQSVEYLQAARNPTAGDPLAGIRTALLPSGAADRAREWGATAALIPFGAILSLSAYGLLGLVMAIRIFQAGSDVVIQRSLDEGDAALPPLANLAWAGLGLVVASHIAAGERPMAVPMKNCLPMYWLALPILTWIADAALLAWVAIEIRNASVAAPDTAPMDVPGLARALPAAMLVCLLALPGRYLAMTVWMMPGWMTVKVGTDADLLTWVFRAQGVGWALGGALLGAFVWTDGRARSAIRNAHRTLKARGGHVVGLMVETSLLAGLGAWATYRILLNLPMQSWTLNAADAYASYVALGIGAVGLAAMVENARLALPVAPRLVRPAGTEAAGRPGAEAETAGSRA